MNVSSLAPWPRIARHDTRREGVRLGIILATTTWLWVMLVDSAIGRPFHTFEVLGGVKAFVGDA